MEIFQHRTCVKKRWLCENIRHLKHMLVRLKMIIHVRFEDKDCKLSRDEKWLLYLVSDSSSLSDIVNGVLSGTLSPKVDLSWADTGTCKYFVAVTGKDLPERNEFSEASGEVTFKDLYERNHRIFLQCVMSGVALEGKPGENNSAVEKKNGVLYFYTFILLYLLVFKLNSSSVVNLIA